MTQKYTGANAETVKNLIIEAGVVAVNYDTSLPYSSQKDKIIGATSGGNVFNATPTYRTTKIDGIRGVAKGARHLQDWEVKLECKFLEFKEDVYKLAIGAATSTKTTINGVNYTEITANDYVKDTDYLDNITLITPVSGSDYPAFLIIYNALGTNGLSIETKDDDDATLEITFEGHYDISNPGRAPYRIIKPDDYTSVDPVDPVDPGTSGLNLFALQNAVDAETSLGRDLTPYSRLSGELYNNTLDDARMMLANPEYTYDQESVDLLTGQVLELNSSLRNKSEFAEIKFNFLFPDSTTQVFEADIPINIEKNAAADYLNVIHSYGLTPEDVSEGVSALTFTPDTAEAVHEFNFPGASFDASLGGK